jgi:hypothetical protein
MNEPTSKFVKVTPDLARQWLSKQVPGENRSLRPSVVKFYAAQIKEGRVEAYWQPLIFSGDRLLDGQHRLHAIVMADKPVDVLVVRGVPESAMSVLDTGVSRKGSDVLSLHGAANPNQAAAVVGHLIRLVASPGAAKTKTSNDEILEFYMREKSLVDWAILLPRAANPKKRNSRLTSAFAFAFKTNSQLVTDIAARFFGDEGLKSGTPLYALHRYVQGPVFPQEARGSGQMAMLKTMQAIQLTMQSKSLTKLITKEGGTAEAARLFFLPAWEKSAQKKAG